MSVRIYSRWGAATLLCTLVTSHAFAFKLLSSSWPDGNIAMHLQLGAPAEPLMDGSLTWGAVAESALNEWNTHLSRSRFTVVRDSTALIRSNNRINNVAFQPTVYGSPFGERVLAVTLGTTNTATGRATERDVLFNSTLPWNSYRGNLRNDVREFRRVALHEFGHVLGLDHPDEDNPRQNVSAVMNSTVGNVETLRADDIAGAATLYGTASGIAPTIAAQPQSSTVAVGNSYTLSVTANGSGPFTYTWSLQPPGAAEADVFHLATGPQYTIGSVQLADAGLYRVAVTSASGGLVLSQAATLTVTPIATSTDTTLANISTRGVVGRGDGVLIAGIVVGGTTPKNVLVRAAGPGLRDFNVSGTLVDPSLAVVDSAGRIVAQNDNWETSGDNTALTSASARLGAFQFRAGSRDAALLTVLAPGNYTAVVSGVNNSVGVALVEAYDADPDAITARSRKLTNIATRGQVSTGDNILIAGLVVAGPGPRTYLIRAIGPTLGKAPFNLSGTLQDPFLQIYQGENLLRENDDWDAPESGRPALREASARVGAFAMMETRDPVTRSGLDAAMLITLRPGSYTAKVSGFEGVTGLALIEIYEMP